MKNYLVNKILDKYEKSKTDWKDKQNGGRSMPIQQSDYNKLDAIVRKNEYQGYGIGNIPDTEDFVTGKECLLKEALWLKKQHLIEIKWQTIGSDIERIKYSLENIEEFYRIAGRESKFALVNKKKEQLCNYQKQIKSDWIKQYYQDRIEEAERGKIEKEEEEILFRCFLAIEKLRVPTYIRVFSSQCLGQSKIFEEKLQATVLAIVKKYHPFVEKNMEDYQILDQLYLDTYSQRLELKGNLIIMLDGNEIDLSVFSYGTILNSDTLKRAKIAEKQSIKKIITVENKANFVSMPYEEGTLILFSHGFFSPLERDFLKQLECVLKDNAEYFHTGDLDYGGVRIFQYIREQIFPLLQPLYMSVEQYKKYEYNAIDIEESALKKLKEVKEPLLQDLIDLICEKRKVIEQENFLKSCKNELIDLKCQ